MAQALGLGPEATEKVQQVQEAQIRAHTLGKTAHRS